jgi:hypothetical protein
LALTRTQHERHPARVAVAEAAKAVEPDLDRRTPQGGRGAPGVFDDAGGQPEVVADMHQPHVQPVDRVQLAVQPVFGLSRALKCGDRLGGGEIREEREKQTITGCLRRRHAVQRQLLGHSAVCAASSG